MEPSDLLFRGGRFVVALLAFAASEAASALPAVLTLVDHRATVEIIGLGVNVFETDPLFKELNAITGAGAIHGLADVVGGVLEASAASLGNQVQLSRPSLFYTFRHDGGMPITLLPGEIKVAVSATFSHVIGVPDSGLWANQFQAGLSSVLRTGQAGITSAFGQRDDAPPTGGASPISEQGFVSVIHHAGIGGLAGTLAFPLVTLMPGDLLNFNVNLEAFALAAGAGWSAVTDASNTALLTMRLPADVTLQSSIPLPWVTVVPEPATAWMLVAGMLALVLGTRRGN